MEHIINTLQNIQYSQSHIDVFTSCGFKHCHRLGERRLAGLEHFGVDLHELQKLGARDLPEKSVIGGIETS